MTDHADIVRDALPALHQLGPSCCCPSCMAHASLDALVAERDEWRKANGEVVGMIAHFVGSDVDGVDDMRLQLKSVLDAEIADRKAAEAREKRLREALRLARQDIITVNTADWDSTRGQAALAAISAIDAVLERTSTND